MIYYMCFILTCFIVSLVNRRECYISWGSGKRKFEPIYATAFLPALLAGVRDQSVGVDVLTYVIGAFRRVSQYTKISDVFNFHTLELGYELIVFGVTRFFNDVHWLHFICALILIIGAYSFFNEYKNALPVALILFAFFCYYYNQSLNTVRQWTAIGIYMFSIKYIRRKQLVPYLIGCIFSIMCHQSAIITIPIYFIYWYVIGNYEVDSDLDSAEQRRRAIRLFLIVALTVTFAVLFSSIVSVLISIGILPNKYLHYLYDNAGNASLVMIILSKMPFVLAISILGQRLKERSKEYNAIMLFIIIDCILAVLSSKFGYAGRVSLYFDVWESVFIAACYKEWSDNVRNPLSKVILSVSFVGLLSAYWFYYYVYRGFSGTYPYVSDVISWLGVW